MVIFRQVRESGIDLQSIPDSSPVDPLRPRHPPVGDHLVEFCRADANVPRGFIAGQATRRVVEEIDLNASRGLLNRDAARQIVVRCAL